MVGHKAHEYLALGEALGCLGSLVRVCMCACVMWRCADVLA